MRAFMHTAWASVLLFGIEGNTRALTSGTAIVQSRFFSFVHKYSTNYVANNLTI